MDYEFIITEQLHNEGHYCQVVDIPTIVLLEEKNIHFEWMFPRSRDFFHFYINGKYILEKIGEMLNGKTYVSEVSETRGYQYKEGVEMLLGKSYVNASVKFTV